jgi:leader peptidase (prepilin peptidase)/N-methyltransferase|tara:strand:+ start:65 stop:943 length:879 start_codon:yes stop_codon:yes gene_type:complete
MTVYLAFLQAEYPLFVLTIAACLGLLIGSFLNVVAYRLPLMLDREWQRQAHEVLGNEEPNDEPPTFNLVLPNSHCPICKHEIAPWENIPLLSYLFLRGRCSGCGTAIPIRYPTLEAITAIVTCVVVSHYGLTVLCLLCLLLSWALLAITVIDYDHLIIPDDIVLPFLWLGLIVNLFGMITTLENAIWGAVFGYLSLWCVFWAFKLLTRKDGMGYGDFKLLAMLGGWMGWQALPVIIILSSFGGTLVGLTLILLGRDRYNPISFGPFLAIAGWIALLWGDAITDLYLKFAYMG